MIKLNGILDTSNKGLMIGNGSVGAIVFGTEYLSFSLDRIDLWDERKPKEYKNPLFKYQNLIRLFKEDYEKAYELFDECYLRPYPTKINAGLIKTDIKVSSFDIETIDVDSGIVTYKTYDNMLTAYVDANQDVIVFKAIKDFNFEIEFPTYFYRKIKDNGLNYPDAIYNKEDCFLVATQPMYQKKFFSIIIYKQNSVLYVTIAKDENIEKSKNLLSNYALNFENNQKKHFQRITKFNKESSVKTPDKNINDLYNLGKYYFYSNSSKKYPVTLQGVWTDYDGIHLPPWKSDLHSDLNLQLSYEPFFKTGNYKECKTLLNYLVKNKKVFENNSKKFLETDGLFIPGVMSQKGEALGGWPQYSLSLCCQIWLVNIFDLYYQYTSDDKYLKNVIFPFFEKMEKSISSYLKEDNENRLVLDFHSSPEFFENEKESLFEYQSNFEITCLKYLYSKLVSYSNRLGLSTWYYQKQLDKIRPFYKNVNGEMTVAKNIEFNMSHRHFSHILCYKNIPIVDTYKEQENIKKDLEVIINQGTNKWVGFSYTEYADFLSLINDGEKSYEALKVFSTNFVHSNGFHMNNDFKEYKYSKMSCYVFTLEGNFSFVNSVNDMLLQNYENKITLFPAIPLEFRKKGVSFKNLRVHGGHKVSAKTKNNKCIFIVKMKSPSTILLMNNFMTDPILTVDGKQVTYKSKIGDFIKIYAEKSILYK